MGVFTSHLTMEHEKIRRGLERLKFVLGSGSTELRRERGREVIAALRVILGEVHHAKEERLLFPALEHSNCPIQGGPHCTFHMGWTLEWDPAGTIARAAESRGLSVEPLPAGLINPYLGIPLGEHRAGHAGIALIERDLSDPAFETKLTADLANYLFLMDHHIKKEDDCLFHLVDSVLDDAAQERLLGQAMELEKLIGRERIDAALAVLAALAAQV